MPRDLLIINEDNEIPTIPILTQLSNDIKPNDVVLQLNNCIQMINYLETHIMNLRDIIILQSKQSNALYAQINELEIKIEKLSKK